MLTDFEYPGDFFGAIVLAGTKIQVFTFDSLFIKLVGDVFITREQLIMAEVICVRNMFCNLSITKPMINNQSAIFQQPLNTLF